MLQGNRGWDPILKVQNLMMRSTAPTPYNYLSADLISWQLQTMVTIGRLWIGGLLALFGLTHFLVWTTGRLPSLGHCILTFSKQHTLRIYLRWELREKLFRLPGLSTCQRIRFASWMDTIII